VPRDFKCPSYDMSNYCFVTTIYDIFALKWFEYPDNWVGLVHIKLLMVIIHNIDANMQDVCMCDLK